MIRCTVCILLCAFCFASPLSAAADAQDDRLDSLRYAFDTAIETIVDVYEDSIAAAVDVYLKSASSRGASEKLVFRGLLAGVGDLSRGVSAKEIPPAIVAAEEQARAEATHACTSALDRYDRALRQLQSTVTDATAYGAVDQERLRVMQLREQEGVIRAFPALREILERSAAFVRCRDRSKYVVMELLYATDRSRTGASQPAEFYGYERGEVDYGTVEVTVPRSHRLGQLESPTWLKLEFTSSSEKHIVLKSISPLSKDAFARRLRDGDGGRDAREDVFLFIHGYAKTYEDAARRTAQVAYDMRFPGHVMFYSWPSRGSFSVSEYYKDEQMVAECQPDLTRVLEVLAENTPPTARVHILAHSIGTRLTSATLMALVPGKYQSKFKDVILAAADIDAGAFKETMIPRLVDNVGRVTIYASDTDRALQFSSGLHDGHRVGLVGDDLFVSRLVDTVDVSGADSHLYTTGHAYYGKSRAVLSDIKLVFLKHLSPPSRLLLERKHDHLTYWRVPIDD